MGAQKSKSKYDRRNLTFEPYSASLASPVIEITPQQQQPDGGEGGTVPRSGTEHQLLASPIGAASDPGTGAVDSGHACHDDGANPGPSSNLLQVQQGPVARRVSSSGDGGESPRRRQSAWTRAGNVDAVRRTKSVYNPKERHLSTGGGGSQSAASACDFGAAYGKNVRAAAGFGSELKLAQAQLNLIRSSWKMARSKGHAEPGLTIFRSTFLKSPEIREVFSDTDVNVSCHAMLKYHAAMFTELMDTLIANLEHDLFIVATLKDIGKRHSGEAARGQPAASTQFKPTHLDILATSMIERTLEWGDKARRNQVSQMAWTKIVLFFVEKIKDGYYEEVRKSKRERMRSRRSITQANSVNVRRTLEVGSEPRAHHSSFNSGAGGGQSKGGDGPDRFQPDRPDFDCDTPT